MSDMISRMDAIQACQVGPSDEWSGDTKSGYYQAATDCQMNILRIRALPSVGVTVKPLEWSGYVDTRLKADVYSVRPTYGQGCKDFLLARSGNVIGHFDDTRTAQAAAQADYEARIISSVNVHPASATSLLVALEWIANNGHLSHPSNIVNVAKEAVAEFKEVK